MLREKSLLGGDCLLQSDHCGFSRKNGGTEGGGVGGSSMPLHPPPLLAPLGLLNYLNEQRRPDWGSDSFEVYKSF